MNIAGRIKISRLAEPFHISRVIAQLGIIETKLHVAREQNRPALVDFLLDFLAQGHSPFRWRSARSCGVRMNISIR